MSFILLNHTLQAESVDEVDTQHNPPSMCSIVELALDLIQLTLQPGEGDISVNPEQMGWFHPL